MIIYGDNRFVSTNEPIYYGSTQIGTIYVGDIQVYPEIDESIIDTEESGGYGAAPFAFQISWNHSGDAKDTDLDIYAYEPANTEGKDRTIYYLSKYRLNQKFTWEFYESLPIYDESDPPQIKRQASACGGVFDIDNTLPGDDPAVENIIWPVANKLIDGDYQLWVTHFIKETKYTYPTDFKASVTLFGTIYNYEYSQLARGEEAYIAIVQIRDHQLYNLIDEADIRTYLGDNTINYATRVSTVQEEENQGE